MTDTPEPVADNAALIERMNQTIRVWEYDEHPNDWWQYQRDFAEALRQITATRPDADIVRQLVETLTKAQVAFAEYAENHRRKLGGALNPSDHRMVIAKVERNRDLSDMCIETLTTARAAGYGSQS